MHGGSCGSHKHVWDPLLVFFKVNACLWVYAVRKALCFDDIFFSAETFTSVGYGERVPVGVMRIPAIAESLNGLMMLGWSGSYLMRVRQHAEMLRF
jgi:hypothetical protein